MTTVILSSHKAQNSLRGNAHRTMATVITTQVFINIILQGAKSPKSECQPTSKDTNTCL